MKKTVIVIIVIISAVAVFLAKTYVQSGEMKKLKFHSYGDCKRIKGAPGAEDIDMDPDTGRVFISSDDRLAAMKGKKKQGAILGFNINDKKPVRLKNLTATIKFEFYPHGISFIKKNGTERLYVINHRSSGHCIEVFNAKGNALVHLKTLRSRLLVSPNDLHAVAIDKLYISNDHGSKSAIARKIEDYFQMKWANVVYYNGKGFSIAAENLAMANGIASTPDGKTLYVATTVGKTLYVYNRNTKNGSLKLKTSLYLDSGLDNLDMDKNGNIWVGAHPKILTLVSHLSGSKKLAPSQIFRVFHKKDGSLGYVEEHLSDGSDIPAASVAVKSGKEMILGSILADGILRCKAK